MPPPALLLVIPIPALIAAAFGLRSSLVMAAGLVGAVAYMIIAMAWPSEIGEPYADTYYVVGYIAFVQSLVVVTFFLLVAQAIKERLGHEDRRTTLVLFAMVLLGGTTSVLPLTIRPPATDGWATGLAEIAAYIFMAGLIGHVITIVIRPVIRRLRGMV